MSTSRESSRRRVARLVQLHLPDLRRMARKIARPGEADDLVQEFVCKLLAGGIDSYDPTRGSFLSWARRCLSRLRCDGFRRRRPQVGLPEGTLVPVDSQPGPASLAESRELRAIIETTPQLTELERRVVRARVGHTFRAISRVLWGVDNAGPAARAFYKARRKLRAQWGGMPA